MLPLLENAAIGNLSEVVVYDTQLACLEAMEEGAVNAVLCSGYLAQYLLSMEYQYSEIEIKTVLSSFQKISAVMLKDGEILLRNIAKKTIQKIETEQINEYMLNENVYHSLSLESFLRAYSVPIILILLVVIIVIIAISSRMIRNGLQVQKLMYKDTDMDIWNLNYFLYWGEHKILPEQKDRYAVAVLNLSQFRRYNII